MDVLLLSIYILAFGSIFWLLSTLQKVVFGSILIMMSLLFFFQYLEIQDLINDMSCSNDIMHILSYGDCEEAETWSNIFFLSGLGSAFFGMYLMFKN